MLHLIQVIIQNFFIVNTFCFFTGRRRTCRKRSPQTQAPRKRKRKGKAERLVFVNFIFIKFILRKNKEFDISQKHIFYKVMLWNHLYQERRNAAAWPDGNLNPSPLNLQSGALPIEVFGHRRSRLTTTLNDSFLHNVFHALKITTRIFIPWQIFSPVSSRGWYGTGRLDSRPVYNFPYICRYYI